MKEKKEKQKVEENGVFFKKKKKEISSVTACNVQYTTKEKIKYQHFLNMNFFTFQNTKYKYIRVNDDFKGEKKKKQTRCEFNN